MFKPLLGAMLAMSTIASAQAGAPNDLKLIKEFARDYESDGTFKEKTVFGVKVGDEFYTVNATPASDGQEATVDVAPGAPKSPTFYFTLESSDYLKKLASGDFNSLTLMAKAFSSDVTPMDIETQKGFIPTKDFGAKILPLTFHFWTKGSPALIPFNAENTRKTHGTNAGIFYYQPGFRSGWFNIEPGDHVNENEKSRTNPFPSLFIIIKGEVTALIDGKENKFSEGNAMLIPAEVSHQFLNKGTDAAFGFLFMFGEGA